MMFQNMVSFQVQTVVLLVSGMVDIFLMIFFQRHPQDEGETPDFDELMTELDGDKAREVD